MLTKIKITAEGNYRAQVVEIGPTSRPMAVDGEPVVEVRLHMPLSDARRLGALMYDFIELRATQAQLSEGIDPCSSTR